MTEDQLKYLENCTRDESDFSFAGYECMSKCVDIYDGDTCRIKFFYKNNIYQYSCRMKGYDTWELKPKKGNRTKESIETEKELAKKAKKKLEELIYHKLVYIKFDDFDKYGRPLITVYLNKQDKKSVNEIMIEEKYAKPYSGGTKKNFDGDN